MSILFRSTELSPAEASFLKWQYGFDDADEPFERALWQAIARAWEADDATGGDTGYLATNRHFEIRQHKNQSSR